MLDSGIPLSLPITERDLHGKTVFFVHETVIVACFDTGVGEELVKELAEMKPLKVVFRDSGFESDSVKINVGQIFKQISPDTEVRSI
jgi:adenine-specific DNA-methyltransferase